MTRSKLLAIRIRRRSVAAAIFSGRQLEYLDILHLCNEPAVVTDSVTRFLGGIIDNFKPADAAVGTSRAQQGRRVEELTQLTESMLTTKGVPLWRIEDKALLESFAVPKLKNKEGLRSIVLAFWPHLSHKQAAAFEAAALGLHVQTERLLSHH
jgi:hypothetical protein